VPIFEFKCNNCNHKFEGLFVTTEEKALVDKFACPACGSADKEKLISSCNHKVNGYSYSNGYSKRSNNRRR
jgi:putative FmdB family regulatory protein